MSVNTGRTHPKWIQFVIKDSGGTLRNIPVSPFSFGLTYEELDVTALQDAIKGVVTGQPDGSFEITGPFDTTAAAAVGTLSGSHTVLQPVNGGVTPLSLDIQVGIRHAWEAGEPEYGITSSSVNGVLVTGYTVDLGSMTYKAKITPAAGSAVLAWGTAART